MKTPAIQAAPVPSATLSEFIATFAVILAAIAGPLLFATAPATVDVRQRKIYAAREFAAGQALITKGSTEPGIEHLRAASTLDADNSAYGVGLAQAILADDRPADAELMLLPLLERNPNDGAANLAMARVLEKEG